MGILAINTQFPGQVGVKGRRIPIISTDNLSTVTTAGYLNPATLLGNVLEPTDVIDMWYGYVSARSPGTFASFIPAFNTETQQITLSLQVSPGNVLLPVVNNEIPVFNGTTGQIKASTMTWDGTTLAVPGVIAASGNISAGLVSGAAGSFTSYPGLANTGFLRWQATANTGNTSVIFTNAAHGQATSYTVQDIGGATGNLINSSTSSHVYEILNLTTLGGHTTSAFTITTPGSPAGRGYVNIISQSNNVAPPRVDASVAGQVSFQFPADPGATVSGNVLIVY